jgi:D-amino peptidase
MTSQPRRSGTIGDQGARRAARAALIACAWALTCVPAARAQTPVRVLISADMEGLAGAVTGEQLGPAGFEYGRFREFMTAEVLAAIEGARLGGATEFLVADAHGNGQNLLIEQLPDDVRVVRSWPRPLGMMEGIDSTFDAAILLGYHAATTDPEGVRAHTISSATLAAVKLNGEAMSEGGISAAIAGHFGVPVVLITGDDAAVAEARRTIGDIEGAVVKQAISFHSATTLTPQAARALIRERAQAAVARRETITPYVLSAPVTLDLTFKNYRPAEMLAYLPNVARIDAHTIRFVGRDMIEVSKFIEFAMSYEPGLTP